MKEYTSNKELDQIMKMLGSSSLLKGLSFETFDSTGIDIGNHYDIEMAASKMCKHLCLLGFTPVITYEAMENAAGNINLNDSLTIYIDINYK